MNFSQRREFICITKDILTHEEFSQTKYIEHHGKGNSVYIHSVATAVFAYRTAKFLRLHNSDVASVTRAALLHDFTGYDWRTSKSERLVYHGIKKLWHMHIFEHGFSAAIHSCQFFSLSDKQTDAIRKHMFPLVPLFPKHKEGWIVTYSDKMVASKEMSRTVWNVCKLGFVKLRYAFS